MNNCAQDEIFKPLGGNAFRFNCHKDIACFTECCAKLQLILTPFDILRMKNRLGLSSDDFLEIYTDMDIKSNSRFPMVRLKMTDNEKKSCPFVTKEGCTIYEDRPGACRLYPVGRAARMVRKDEGKNSSEQFFLVEESHCLGFKEQRNWTLDEWLGHEGVREYNARNDQWLEIIKSNKGLGSNETSQKKIQMFFMASYNLDKFRKFIFKSKFFDIFDVAPDLKKELESDDTALMGFAIDWLKFSLFGEKTIELKSHAV